MSLSLLSAGTMNRPVMGEMKLQMGRIEISRLTSATAGQSVILQQGKSSTSVLHSRVSHKVLLLPEIEDAVNSLTLETSIRQ